MAKKAKKRIHPMPPLGWQDLLLYWSGMILTSVGMLACMIFPLSYRERMVFSNPQVVAFTGGRGSLHYFWLFFWLTTVLILIAAGPYQHRYPIFGKKGVKYGPPAYPRVFPLLMKNKPQYWVSPKKQADRKLAFRIFVTVMAVWLAFSILMLPRSFYGRNELHRDGTVTVYTSRNEEEMQYGLSNIISVQLDTYREGGGKRSTPKWSARMTITMSDGEEFSFSAGSFRGDWSQSFQEMTALKERYGPLVTIEGSENLHKIVRDRGLDASETETLYHLFDQNINKP